jgi:FkbM family methyltransferase
MEAICNQLPPSPVIVDLGANQDIFLPVNILDRAEVHAVEPDPTVFKILRKNVGDRKNVVLYNVAIGAEDGEVSFYRERGFNPADPARYSLGASVFSEHEAINRTEQIKVPQIGILSFLQKIGKPVDLMKMDIEGAEVPVLETLLDSHLLHNISVILVETHEHVLPTLVDRTDAIRRRVKNISRPRINMNWH